MNELKFKVMNGAIHVATECLTKLGWIHILENNNGSYDGFFDEFECGHTTALPRLRFTGITDSNEKEAFENDTIQILSREKSIIKFGYCDRFGYTGWYAEGVESGRISQINQNGDPFIILTP